MTIIKNINNIKDIERLKYDIIKFYDLTEVNGVLKTFTIGQLTRMINGLDSPNDFIESQRKIASASIINSNEESKHSDQSYDMVMHFFD